MGDSGIPRGVNELAYHALVSGERRGASAGMLRGLLWLLMWPYRLGVALRAFGFRSGLLSVHESRAPVVSIGNLTTGGTGKTPLVAWTANYAAANGIAVGLLSRGYRNEPSASGADSEVGNDEYRLLAALCPDIPHLQDPDRVRAARRALDEHSCDLLVLDDGFQHRRLARDLDIVLIDATNPTGHGFLLPRGLLREPLAALKRSRIIVITRVDRIAPADLQRLRSDVATWSGHDRIAEVAFVATGLVNASGHTQPLEILERQQPVVAFCGIGNPGPFLASVTPSFSRVFPDHHNYSRDDLDSLEAWAREHDAGCLVTTRKDLVKIPHDRLGDTPLWALEIGAEWIAGESLVTSELDRLFAGRAA